MHHIYQVFQLMSMRATPPPSPLFLPPLNDGDNSQNANSVLYIQPTPIGIASRQRSMANWSTGLFRCHSDMKTCCKTLFCPCITSSEIVEIITEGKTLSGDALVILGVCAVICGMWTYTCRTRTIIRTKFNIRGSPCNDCLTHACCLPCALCQEYRELDHHGFDPSLGWFENLERQRYAVAIYTITPPKPEKMERT
ncbi:protein PLANT CADMIUM RESISTANCE 7 [Sesamum indicum]|uniref:Protein PLANT CADMIUM RESISTANCE 7 n=1 Tax=Sesamum indicum TaxID=4182 RepID=A0A6I9TS49_SESIN|nr:protein PLANT CADMIUM RESISTANCE 7 [Sesamum indicum]XP_011084084.1 protein PLANT CADMIUM RESISTANCE 7 [Sesamum indicum]